MRCADRDPCKTRPRSKPPLCSETKRRVCCRISSANARHPGTPTVMAPKKFSRGARYTGVHPPRRRLDPVRGGKTRFSVWAPNGRSWRPRPTPVPPESVAKLRQPNAWHRFAHGMAGGLYALEWPLHPAQRGLQWMRCADARSARSASAARSAARRHGRHRDEEEDARLKDWVYPAQWWPWPARSSWAAAARVPIVLIQPP
jgi:hypothetical protein